MFLFFHCAIRHSTFDDDLYSGSGANAWSNLMRYIVYGVAIFAAMLAIAFTTGNLPRDATASHSDRNDTMNVLQLEQTKE
jgi:hypothetical protein